MQPTICERRVYFVGFGVPAVAALPPAVVLDVDETVLDNLTYQLERAKIGLAFTPDSWNVWVKRREAVGLPGSAAFLARAGAEDWEEVTPEQAASWIQSLAEEKYRITSQGRKLSALRMLATQRK